MLHRTRSMLSLSCFLQNSTYNCSLLKTLSLMQGIHEYNTSIRIHITSFQPSIFKQHIRFHRAIRYTQPFNHSIITSRVWNTATFLKPLKKTVSLQHVSSPC
ncbi:hypothetical protein Hanom_Chr04g00349351 [Helianthus anomalus]